MSDCPCVPCPNAANERGWRELAKAMEARCLAAESRAERAEALLKEAGDLVPYCSVATCKCGAYGVRDRIDAHLSETKEPK